jgi:hypothetical protein
MYEPRKEVICTILGQFRRLFVSAANAGLKVLGFQYMSGMRERQFELAAQ